MFPLLHRLSTVRGPTSPCERFNEGSDESTAAGLPQALPRGDSHKEVVGKVLLMEYHCTQPGQGEGRRRITVRNPNRV